MTSTQTTADKMTQNNNAATLILLDFNVAHAQQCSYDFHDWGWDGRDYVEDFAFSFPEAYDEDWYALFVTPAIEATVNWAWINEQVENERYATLVDEMFA
jgi:hypothetical protein